MFYGSILFRFFGVLVILVYKNLFALGRRRKLISFNEIWSYTDESDPINSISYEMKCIIIGAFFLLVIISFLRNLY